MIHEALGRVFPAAQLEVRAGGEVALSRAYGWLDPDARQCPTRSDTLFDLASVTKLFVVTAFMALVQEGKAGLDRLVCTVLPAFDGPRPIQPYEDPLNPGELVPVDAGQPTTGQAGMVDASQVTFRHLLAHTSGLPAWRPLYREDSAEAAQRLALTTFFSYPTGARTIYSDIGLILLGMGIERLTGLRLDEAVRWLVTEPLGMERTRYLPIKGSANGRVPQGGYAPSASTGNIVPTEFCAWRGRRIVGEVHDENAARLGGIAGHAGLFSTASDVATLGQSYLARIQQAGQLTQGQPVRLELRLSAATVTEMTRLQAEDGMIRRGLGFVLWSPDREASGNPLGQRAFGHTGFTGTSLWVDPDRALVIACLTNRVYYGREASGILAFRVALHRAIIEAIERS